MTTLFRNLAQDIRYAVRQLRRAPAFAFTTLLTLALGVGSAAAVFSVVDAVFLQPLPFAHQDRLVFPDTHARSGYQQPWSYLSYVDAAAQLNTFQEFAGYINYFKINLESPSGPVALQAVKSTANFFNVFGVRPLLGRTYLPGEDQPGKDDVAVLSYEVWQADFGGQRDAVGKVVRFDGVPYTVIGVMPAGFRFPLAVRNAVYTPLHADPMWTKSRGSHWMRTVGLLKAGVSREQAQADFRNVLANLGRQFPDTDQGRTVEIIPLQTEEMGTTGGPLKALAFAVLALLAIACVNVAGLLLARGVKREREMALRAAVGAGRTRIIRQMLAESLVLSAGGLAGGVVIGWSLLAAMRSFLDTSIARGTDVRMNLPVLLVAALLSALTSILASLAPALRLSGTDPNRALRSGGSAGTGRGQNRLRFAFVMTQVALSLVLLVVSGLLLQNLRSLLHTSLGFDPTHILATDIALSPGRYEGRDPLVSFYQPLLERASHLPGVQAVGLVNMLPIKNYGNNSDVHITGQPPYPPEQEMLAESRLVSSGYFDAMGMKLVRGRALSPDLDKAVNPAGSDVVNEAFRRKFFSSGGDPVGAHMDDSDKPEQKTGIVGIVSDARQHLTEPALAEMDFLIDEIDPKDRATMLNNMTLVVRASGDLQQLVAPLRDAMHQIDPTTPFQAPETMTEVVSESVVLERMEGWLFGIFAGLALLLSLVGIYGMVHHEVELRTRDIGVRMALGSSRGRVVRDILQRVAVLLLSGITVGWLLTLAMRKVLASVVPLNGVHDAALLATITIALALVGLLASLLPARHAASIDPMQALRNE